MLKHPIIVIKHYLKLDAYLYSPFKYEGLVGIFTETDLWVYKGQYSELEENSKLPKLLNVLKKQEAFFQTSPIRYITLQPAIYLYLTIFITIVLVKIYKSKNIILVSILSFFNLIGLSVAMPVAMVRYVYSTILLGYLFILWGFWLLLVRIKERKVNKVHNI